MKINDGHITRRTFMHGAAAAALSPWQMAQGAAETAKAKPPASSARPAANDEAGSGILSEEFSVTVKQRTIVPRLLSPPRERLAAKPFLLLNIAADRETCLTVEPFCMGVKLFLAHGHRALSFDLPNHGTRVDKYGEGIAGWRNAWVDGEDRFAMFVEEASAVIDRCLQSGQAEAGRVVVYGVSRGGYLALRLLAADPRVAAASAIGPVSDWRDLTEFAAERKREDVAALRLSRFADALAGKRVFVVIGNSDQRVSTASSCRFFLDLVDANARHGHDASQLEFHCAAMSETGHVVDNSWRRLGAEFLLKGHRHG